MITLHQLCVIENPHKGITWNKVQPCKLLQNISFDRIVSDQGRTLLGLDVSRYRTQHVSDTDTFLKLLASSAYQYLCRVRYSYLYPYFIVS